jgi:hypothetical protein
MSPRDHDQRAKKYGARQGTSAVTHDKVGNGSSGVIEHESSVCPFLDQRKSGYQKRDPCEEVPDPQDAHEIRGIP